MLLSRIPMVEDLQSAWALLLHCAGGRANYMLRVVRPEAVQTFAEHSDGLWSCLRNILGVTLDTNPTFGTLPRCLYLLAGWVSATLFARVLRHSGQAGQFAFQWSENDTPRLPRQILRRVGDPMAPPTLVAARTVAGQLVGVLGSPCGRPASTTP